MKKMIVLLLLVIFFTTGCSKVGLKSAQQHLENKYNENFTYVQILDSSVNVFDITNGTKYHFVSENGDNISVVCGKQGNKYSCVDGYYQYLIYEEMFEEIKNIVLKYIPNMKMNIGFMSSIFEDSWDKDTSLEQALSENSFNLHTYVDIFTYDIDENIVSQIEENMWSELEQKGLSLYARIYNISFDEYSNLQTIKNNELSKEEYDSFMDRKGYTFKETLSKSVQQY